MKRTHIDVMEIFRPVVGLKPTRAKLGVGSFLTFDFGPLSREDHHMVGRWHLWVHQAYWSLKDKQREIVNADSERRYINLAVPRLESCELLGVNVDSESLQTEFHFGNFRLFVKSPDYVDELDD